MIKIYKSLADQSKVEEALGYTPLFIESEEELVKETVILATIGNRSLLQALADIRERIAPKQDKQLQILKDFTPAQLKTIQEKFATDKNGKSVTEDDLMIMLSDGVITVEQINSLTQASKVEKPTISEVMDNTDLIIKVLGIDGAGFSLQQRKELFDLTINNEYNFF